MMIRWVTYLVECVLAGAAVSGSLLSGAPAPDAALQRGATWRLGWQTPG